MSTCLARLEQESETPSGLYLRWSLRAEDALRNKTPFEIDDEDLAQGLAELPSASPISPHDLASLEEAEVPSLWLF